MRKTINIHEKERNWYFLNKKKTRRANVTTVNKKADIDSAYSTLTFISQDTANTPGNMPITSDENVALGKNEVDANKK